jgi:hypothetical protein
MTVALKTIDSGPRFIDPNSSITKQVEQLNALRLNPPENSRRVKITPRLAEHILTHLNPHNRAKRTTHIAQYARDMTEGRWALTGDTIKFGRSGILRDGQHRLAACVRAGTPFETYCVFGISDESFSVMDIGRKRKGDDAFTIAGISNANSAAAAVRWVLILTSDNPTDRSVTFANTDLLDAYRKLKQPLFDDCVAEAKMAAKNARQLHESALAAILYLFSQKNAKAVAAFLADVRALRGGAKRAINLIDKVRQQNMGRMHEVQRNAILINTLKFYAAGGVPRRESEIAWNETMDFPVI